MYVNVAVLKETQPPLVFGIASLQHKRRFQTCKLSCVRKC
jgi:hypothetical protein